MITIIIIGSNKKVYRLLIRINRGIRDLLIRGCILRICILRERRVCRVSSCKA